MVSTEVSRLDEAIREHRELLDAIDARDGDRAEAVARAHVTGFQQEIGRVLTREQPRGPAATA